MATSRSDPPAPVAALRSGTRPRRPHAPLGARRRAGRSGRRLPAPRPGLDARLEAAAFGLRRRRMADCWPTTAGATAAPASRPSLDLPGFGADLDDLAALLDDQGLAACGAGRAQRRRNGGAVLRRPLPGADLSPRHRRRPHLPGSDDAARHARPAPGVRTRRAIPAGPGARPRRQGGSRSSATGTTAGCAPSICAWDMRPMLVGRALPHARHPGRAGRARHAAARPRPGRRRRRRSAVADPRRRAHAGAGPARRVQPPRARVPRAVPSWPTVGKGTAADVHQGADRQPG